MKRMRRIYINRRPVTLYLDSRWGVGPMRGASSLARLALQKALDKVRDDHQKFSISHTKGLGGFAISRGAVGFDVERFDRPLSVRAVARLAHPEELEQGTGPLWLWVMKEAAWKSMRGDQQPLTVTKIRILSVRSGVRGPTFTFGVVKKTTDTKKKTMVLGHGCFFSDGDYSIALAIRAKT